MAKRCLNPVLSLYSVFTAAAILATACAYADTGLGGPFLGLSGQWSGSGTITMADGSTESLRCKSANVVNANGRAIQQSLRCASDGQNRRAACREIFLAAPAARRSSPMYEAPGSQPVSMCAPKVISNPSRSGHEVEPTLLGFRSHSTSHRDWVYFSVSSRDGLD
jgi:hypothetical protein